MNSNYSPYSKTGTVYINSSMDPRRYLGHYGAGSYFSGWGFPYNRYAVGYPYAYNNVIFKPDCRPI
jgi:hypothetical protein